MFIVPLLVLDLCAFFLPSMTSLIKTFLNNRLSAHSLKLGGFLLWLSYSPGGRGAQRTPFFMSNSSPSPQFPAWKLTVNTE